MFLRCFTYAGLLVSGCISFVLAAPPARAQANFDLVRIYRVFNASGATNVPIDVRYCRGNCPEGNWRTVQTSNLDLRQQDWIQTGSASLADYELDSPRLLGDVFYYQAAYTRSRFDLGSGGRCEFSVVQGASIYARSGASPAQGCIIHTPHASAFSGGVDLALAAIPDVSDDASQTPTDLEILTAIRSDPNIGSASGAFAVVADRTNQASTFIALSLPLTITALNGGDTVQINPGEFAKVLTSGEIQIGRFNIADFLENTGEWGSALSGCGGASEVSGLSPESQATLSQINQEICTAINNQQAEITGGVPSPPEQPTLCITRPAVSIFIPDQQGENEPLVIPLVPELDC